MIVQAPGKVVLSGAYTVLEGAPAVVAAVNRFVRADASRPADFLTPEVAAALEGRHVAAPWFDASALRQDGQKLGMGSSAAILVASLGALEARDLGPLPDAALQEAVLHRALRAHHRAQQGGSGIDVAAAVHGGTLLASLEGGELRTTPAALPQGLCVNVWFSGRPASTADLLRRVFRLRDEDPKAAGRLLGAQAVAAERAARAIAGNDAAALVEAAGLQREALEALGGAAGAEIVTPAVRELDLLARAEGAAVLPSGAGGGDVTVCLGVRPPSQRLAAAARRLGQAELPGLALGARGVHVCAPVGPRARRGEEVCR